MKIKNMKKSGGGVDCPCKTKKDEQIKWPIYVWWAPMGTIE
jgi:hypothetical protein